MSCSTSPSGSSRNAGAPGAGGDDAHMGGSSNVGNGTIQLSATIASASTITTGRLDADARGRRANDKAAAIDSARIAGIAKRAGTRMPSPNVLISISHAYGGSYRN